MDDRIQRLLDESEIRELVLGNARALDERDWAAYGAGFTEDGVLEIAGRCLTGRREIAAGPAQLLTRYDRTQHYLANLSIVLDGDEATAVGYGISVHVPVGAQPATHADMGNVWHCRCRRTDEGWKVSHLRVEFRWEAGIPMFEPAAGTGQR